MALEPDGLGAGEDVARLRARVVELEQELALPDSPATDSMHMGGVRVQWNTGSGTMSMDGDPVVLLWLDTTVAAILSGVLAMVGVPRSALCLRSGAQQGAQVDLARTAHDDFLESFSLWSTALAAGGWGRWEVENLDMQNRQARFRVVDSWEGRLQSRLGQGWGSCVAAGKLAGLCSALFGGPCRTEQTAFLARGDAHDAFLVEPSSESPEEEMDRLLQTDQATGADMAVALQRMRRESAERARLQAAEAEIRESLEQLVQLRTRELATAHHQLCQEVQERRQAQEFFHQLAQAIPQSLLVASLPELKVLYLNPAFQRLTGYEAGAVPDFEHWAALAYPDQRHVQARRDRFRRLQDGALRELSYESRVRIASGEFRDMAFWCTCCGPQRLLVLARDVTEIRQMDRDRQRLHEQKQHHRRMEAVGRLAGGLSRDLDRLVATLANCPGLFTDGPSPDGPPTAAVKLIRQAGERARGVVEDLMALAPGAPPPRRECDLNRVVEDYLASQEDLGLEARHPGFRVQADLHPDLPALHAAPQQLARSLANLVSQAAGASADPGPVSLLTGHLHLETPLPGLEDVAPGHYVVLSVTDSGPQISHADQARLFEPFYTRSVLGRPGTGLELAVVWSIVQEHRGSIQVQSGPQGTRFDVFFPTARSEA